MALFNWHGELARDGHRVILSGQTVAMHCHHYNINLQKTVEEALGDEVVRLLFSSVEKASYLSLLQLLDRYQQIKTLKSKLEIASFRF